MSGNRYFLSCPAERTATAAGGLPSPTHHSIPAPAAGCHSQGLPAGSPPAGRPGARHTRPTTSTGRASGPLCPHAGLLVKQLRLLPSEGFSIRPASSPLSVRLPGPRRAPIPAPLLANPGADVPLWLESAVAARGYSGRAVRRRPTPLEHPVFSERGSGGPGCEIQDLRRTDRCRWWCARPDPRGRSRCG